MKRNLLLVAGIPLFLSISFAHATDTSESVGLAEYQTNIAVTATLCLKPPLTAKFVETAVDVLSDPAFPFEDPKAVASLSGAIENGTKTWSSSARKVIAQCCIAKGDYVMALEMLETLHMELPEDVSIAFPLAELLVMCSNDYSRAHMLSATVFDQTYSAPACRLALATAVAMEDFKAAERFVVYSLLSENSFSEENAGLILVFCLKTDNMRLGRHCYCLLRKIMDKRAHQGYDYQLTRSILGLKTYLRFFPWKASEQTLKKVKNSPLSIAVVFRASTEQCDNRVIGAITDAGSTN